MLVGSILCIKYNIRNKVTSIVNKYPTGAFDSQMGLQEKNTPPNIGVPLDKSVSGCSGYATIWAPVVLKISVT